MDEKSCTQCGVLQPLGEYYAHPATLDGCRSECKSCTRLRQRPRDAARRNRNPERERTRQRVWYSNNARRHAANAKAWALRERTPAWADRAALIAVYENRPEGYEVDHIIPVNGVGVSGLHVASNLQYLTRAENRAKGNTWDGGVQ